MKKSVLKSSLLAVLCTFTIACNKINEGSVSGKSSSSAATVSKDSATIAAEKKKKAQQEMAKLPKPYHPEDNAEAKLAEIVKKAQKENKNIMIQVGGNWCIWCLRFNNFVQTTPELKEMVDKNYIYYHLNYSPEEKNEKVLAKYGNPGEKFGYPVFVVLDKNGKQIHIQDSSLLEEGKGYSLQKVKDFFGKWVPKG